MTEKIHVPSGVAALRDALIREGFRACPVGGCVRDSLLGRTPEDWDICTSARPERILALFPGSVSTGGAYGTVTVSTDSGPVEVTPFRREGSYADGRHPDRVSFEASLEEDLARRDFTVNAMALDEKGNIVDLFGGRADLERGLIRCVGNPEARFREDALRMFRGVRFAAQLGFDLEGETAQAIRRCAPLAARLAPERVGQEVERALLSPRPGLAGGFFQLGLIPGLAARWPEGASALAGLPAKRLLRWAGLCACLMENGMIRESAPFLSGLRLEGKLVRACAGGEALWRSGLPREGRQWRHALARWGAAACQAAAARGGGEALSLLDRTLAARPCIRVRDLALSGGDLAALGLSGPGIGLAQRALLERVLDRPEDNNRETLRQFLAETGHI